MNSKPSFSLAIPSPKAVRGPAVLGAVALAFSLLTVQAAWADPLYEGKVEAVRISVWRFADQAELTTILPGDSLKLNPGQRVILRLFSPKDKNPTGERLYLSAEITLEDDGSENVDLMETDHDKGSAVVQALRRGAGKTATLRYRLLGEVEVARDYQGANTIPVEIAKESPAAAKPPTAKPRLGVTLYEDSYYRGDSETFYEGNADLRYSRIRNDRATSIKVPEGCTVTLYRDTGYRGRIAVLRSDTPELGRTPVGNDAVSSLKVECE